MKIREAVEGIKEQYGIDKDNQVNGWLQSLLDLAEAYLAVSAVMPEKKYNINMNFIAMTEFRVETPLFSAYNQAIEECTLAVTKGWVKKEERAKVYCTHTTDCRCERCEPPKERG